MRGFSISFRKKGETFVTKDINWCYGRKLSYKPGNTSQYLINMERAGELLGNSNSGYRCEGKLIAKYDDLYKEHDVTINVRQMVKGLVNVIPHIEEKDIFDEAMKCLKYDAGRAAEIMVWNIAMYHLYQFILAHHLQEFNDRVPIRYKNKWEGGGYAAHQGKYEDFGDEMSEREVIDAASSTGIINDGIFKTYKNRLDQRNSAAHPSTLRVTQVQAEGFIDDLIRNAVLQLKS